MPPPQILERLLTPGMIPKSLLCGERILSFPPELSSAYRQVLTEMDRVEAAMQAQVNGGTGGQSEEQTIRHFVENFSGSCGRMKLAILDPNEQLDDASNLFITAFSGGKVALLDAPCGSGAATLTLLCVIAALRKESVLPRIPLEIHVVCADISDSALQITRRLLNAASPFLERQAVFVHAVFQNWDMQDRRSQAELNYAWSSIQGCPTRFLIKANTSGFLNNPTNFKKAKDQLEQLLLLAQVSKATAIWIEPKMSEEAKGLRLNLRDAFLRVTKPVIDFFKTKEGGDMDVRSDEGRLRHPIRTGEIHEVRISLMRSKS